MEIAFKQVERHGLRRDHENLKWLLSIIRVRNKRPTPACHRPLQHRKSMIVK